MSPWDFIRTTTSPVTRRGALLISVIGGAIIALVWAAFGQAPNPRKDPNHNPSSIPGPVADSGPPRGPESCGLPGGFSLARSDWGPDRATYTIDTADGQEPVFNSITNNPSYGNELAFVDAKDTHVKTMGGYCRELAVVDGETLWLRAYAENSAQDPTRIEPPDVRVATNSRIEFIEDSDPSSLRMVTAVITSDNANPSRVWSTLALVGTTPFRLDLLGQVIVYSNQHPSGYPIADTAWNGGGALFGFDHADGQMRPGYQYALVVVATVRVTYLDPR